jgi:hypothetical protein
MLGESVTVEQEMYNNVYILKQSATTELSSWLSLFQLCCNATKHSVSEECEQNMTECRKDVSLRFGITGNFFFLNKCKTEPCNTLLLIVNP